MKIFWILEWNAMAAILKWLMTEPLVCCCELDIVQSVRNGGGFAIVVKWRRYLCLDPGWLMAAGSKQE